MTKIIIVTGGVRGIGAEICKKFAKAAEQENQNIVLIANYRSNDSSALQLKSQIAVETMKWDVADFEQCRDMVAEIEDKYGKAVDVLVNNAGVVRDAMLHKLEYEHWQKVINTNLSSCFNMCKAVILGMRQQEQGKIINLASINALSGQIGQSNYAAAKAGVIGFTKSLALESARRNIQVNAVCPGYVDTDMTSGIPPEFMKMLVKKIPAGRLGRPEEIAEMVYFLASSSANFITGQAISVNGGQYM